MNCLDDCHAYELDNFRPPSGGPTKQFLRFYRMALDGETTAGVTNEEIIEMLIHRLTFLNEKWFGGKFKCRENFMAITKLEEALMWLERRTAKRIARGVEATHEA